MIRSCCERDAYSPEQSLPAPARYVVDSHCHVSVVAGALTQAALLAAATQSSTRLLVCATAPDVDWAFLAALSKAAADEPAASAGGGGVSVAFGVHPWWVNDSLATDWELRLTRLLEEFPRACVGEIGLDRHRGADAPGFSFDAQVAAFEAQMSIAARMRRPVSVHCVRAFGPMLDLLCRRPVEMYPPAVVMHGYTGSTEFARQLLKLSHGRGARFYFGLGASTTGTLRQFADLVGAIPRGRVLVESDGFANAGVSECHAARARLWAMAARLAEAWGVPSADAVLIENHAAAMHAS